MKGTAPIGIKVRGKVTPQSVVLDRLLGKVGDQLEGKSLVSR